MKRYVDDGIAIIPAQVALSTVVDKLNGWHPSIVVKPSEVYIGLEPHILDLQLSTTSDSRIFFSTYVKPLAIGDFVPPISAHRPSTSRSIFCGEVHRLIITNTFAPSFAQHCIALMQKGRRRGFSTRQLAHVLESIDHDSRPKLLSSRRQHDLKHKPLSFGLTVRYCKGLESLKWDPFANTMRSLGVEFQNRYSVSKSLFRMLYQSTWKGGRASV